MSITDREETPDLRSLVAYFLKLGALGFGRPALLGHMQRDLQADKHWISRDEYKDGLAIAQTMPGPIAAQLAMWIGLIRYGPLGATLTGLAFILPSFVLVVALGAAYVAFEGLPQIQGLSYGIGAAIVAFIALSAWRLARSTDGRDPRLWACTIVVMAASATGRVDLVWLVLLAGALGILVYAPPRRREKTGSPAIPGLLPALPINQLPTLAVPLAVGGTTAVLAVFFLKAAIFNFAGLAIIPFMHAGVVLQHHWLNERQFVDAVAVGMITPGPAIIAMVAFVGYLVAGPGGATVAMLAVSAPVWVFNVAVGPLFLRYRRNAQLRGFVKGHFCGGRSNRRRRRSARARRHHRPLDRGHLPACAGGALYQARQRTVCRRRRRDGRSIALPPLITSSREGSSLIVGVARSVRRKARRRRGLRVQWLSNRPLLTGEFRRR